MNPQPFELARFPVHLHTFDGPWDSWEMHPKGAELVAGQAIINPPGVWHTADVDGRASALFVTAGVGTEIRPR